MARAETEELAGRPVFIALQVLPVSVLLNTPPASCAPAYSVLGVRGSMASAPMAAVAGPWLVQALMPACTVCARAAKSTAQISAGARRMPRAPDRHFADPLMLAPPASSRPAGRDRQPQGHRFRPSHAPFRPGAVARDAEVPTRDTA